MQTIGRYDYPAQFEGDFNGLLRDIGEMLLNGSYVLGKAVQDFEQDFADWLGCRHAVGVNSGTDALYLAFMALGIGPGDEVITQANTFHATAAAIHLTGATPVLVDVDPATYLMDASAIEAHITARTKAIVPVHLYGKVCDMARICDIARAHNLAIVEDAAQSHGARLDGKATGTFGDLGCFSFHPSKNLAAAGDAGMIVTHRDDLKERLHILRSLGQRGQNEHIAVGLNSKLDALQARVLAYKLPKLDGWNADRRRVATAYRDALQDLPLQFQQHDSDASHVYHLFQIQTMRRDGLLKHLKAQGIDAVVRYPTPIHLQEAFAFLDYREGDFPNAERLARELLCLPIRPLMTKVEIEHVGAAVRSFFEEQL